MLKGEEYYEYRLKLKAHNEIVMVERINKT